MKKQLLTLVFGISSTMLAFTACKKDKDAEPSDSKAITCLPDTLDYRDNGKSILVYNSQRQLVRINNYDKDGQDDGYIVLSYSTNMITETEYKNNGTKTYEGQHFLNDNGSVNHTYEVSTLGVLWYDSIYYSYNNNEQMILKVIKSGNSVDSTKYVYANGNLISSTQTYGNEKRSSTYTTSNKENKFNIFEDRVLIPGFYGKGSKNLLSTEIDYLPDGSIHTITYNYEVNSDGYLTQRSFVDIDSKNPDEVYWEASGKINYICK